MAKPDYYLITCEHGGNRIPPRYRPLFAGTEPLLQTHRGYDPGALALAGAMSRTLNAPLFSSTISRLLIDLNRSVSHPRLYSEATRNTPPTVRRAILEKIYLPYRNQVETAIAAAIARGSRVIHLSAHSFTPELDGTIRNADIGLLYDPSRGGEMEMCRCWQRRIKAMAPRLKVRRNYPYTGTSDGFTAYLRRRFPAESYIGIEVEINQKHVFRGGQAWATLQDVVIGALRQTIAAPTASMASPPATEPVGDKKPGDHPL